MATVFREHPSALSNCSVSSDACGSLPVFDEHGKLLEYKVAMKPSALTCTSQCTKACQTMSLTASCCWLPRPLADDGTLVSAEWW